MSMTQRERARFLYEAGREGLPIETARKLLRYGVTLHRLAEAQCNGDWPFNGDRDRPSRTFRTCEHCNGTAKVTPRPWRGTLPEPEGYLANDCLDCQGTGKLQTNGRECVRWDARYGTCSRCQERTASSVLLRGRLCSGCRTSDAAIALMVERNAALYPGRDYMSEGLPRWQAEFQGDPRGAVLTIKAPSGRELVAG